MFDVLNADSCYFVWFYLRLKAKEGQSLKVSFLFKILLNCVKIKIQS